MTRNVRHNALVITVEDLHKIFAGKQVMNGVSFELSRGETLSILGRSGQGKSVLIKCIVRLLLPDGGHIEVFGQDVQNLEEK